MKIRQTKIEDAPVSSIVQSKLHATIGAPSTRNSVSQTRTDDKRQTRTQLPHNEDTERKIEQRTVDAALVSTAKFILNGATRQNRELWERYPELHKQKEQE